MPKPLSSYTFHNFCESFPKRKRLYLGDIEISYFDDRFFFWYKRVLVMTIRPDGTAIASYNGSRLPEKHKRIIWDVMRSLEEDFYKEVTKWGRDTGICGVCGAPLTDPESVARGIGPVCATKINPPVLKSLLDT